MVEKKKKKKSDKDSPASNGSTVLMVSWNMSFAFLSAGPSLLLLENCSLIIKIITQIRIPKS